MKIIKTAPFTMPRSPGCVSARQYLVSNPNKASAHCNRTCSRARLQSIGHNICAMGGKVQYNESVRSIKSGEETENVERTLVLRSIWT